MQLQYTTPTGSYRAKPDIHCVFVYQQDYPLLLLVTALSTKVLIKLSLTLGASNSVSIFFVTFTI